MSNILLLFAHPLLEKSRVHVELLKKVNFVEGITINDLYERYPDYDIKSNQSL
jgi:glutathione-regulated potassium-efflux system ancillary protein KefG